MRFLNKIGRNQKGATAIEYGLIAAMISVAAIGAMSSLGSSVKNTFQDTGDYMTGAKLPK